MPLYVNNGQLFQVGGQLAANENCCCEEEPCDDDILGCCCFGSFSEVTQQLSEFGITECDCDLMGGTWRANCDDCESTDGYGDVDDSTAPPGQCNVCKTITITYSSFDDMPLEFDNDNLCDNSCPTDCVSTPGNTNCADSFPGFPGALSGALSCYCDDCGAGAECFAVCHNWTDLDIAVTFQVQTGPCTSFTQSSSTSTGFLECGCGDATYNSSSIQIKIPVTQINTGQSYTGTGTNTTKDKLSGECSGLHVTSTTVTQTVTC
jgi:hypothetical protein